MTVRDLLSASELSFDRISIYSSKPNSKLSRVKFWNIKEMSEVILNLNVIDWDIASGTHSYSQQDMLEIFITVEPLPNDKELNMYKVLVGFPSYGDKKTYKVEADSAEEAEKIALEKARSELMIFNVLKF